MKINLTLQQYADIIVKAGTVIILVICVLYFKCSHNEQKERHSLQSIIIAKDAEIRTWKDNAQQWHTQTTVADINSHKALKLLVAYDTNFQRLSKDFVSLKKSMRNLSYYNTHNMGSTYHITAPVTDTSIIDHNDTTQIQIIDVADSAGWYNFKAVINTHKVAVIDFNTKDSISTVVTFKRRWFLGRKRYTQEIISHNPHSKINYARSIIVHK
jgi:hypothetical protein